MAKNTAFQNIINYFSLAIPFPLSNTTLDLSRLPDSYFPPILLIFFISFLISIIDIFFISKDMQSFMIILNVLFLKVLSGVFVVSFFFYGIFSLINSVFLRESHSAQLFGLNISSISYIPIVFSIRLVLPPGLLPFLLFLFVIILSSNYIIKSYNLSFFNDNKTSILHRAFIYIFSFIMIIAVSNSPITTIKHIFENK